VNDASSGEEKVFWSNMSRRPFSLAEEEVAAGIVRASASSLYDVLNVSPSCSPGSISKAYKKAALRLHPDKNSAPSAELAMRAVNEAFETLSDPMKREWYDWHGPPASPTEKTSAETAMAAAAAATDPTTTEGDGAGGGEVDAIFEKFIKKVVGSRHSTDGGGLRHVLVLLFLVLAMSLSLIFSPGDGSGSGSNPQHRPKTSFFFIPSQFGSVHHKVAHTTHGPRIRYYTDGPSALDDGEVERQLKALLIDLCGTGGKNAACVKLETLFFDESSK